MLKSEGQNKFIIKAVKKLGFFPALYQQWEFFHHNVAERTYVIL